MSETETTNARKRNPMPVWVTARQLETAGYLVKGEGGKYYLNLHNAETKEADVLDIETLAGIPRNFSEVYAKTKAPRTRMSVQDMLDALTQAGYKVESPK